MEKDFMGDIHQSAGARLGSKGALRWPLSYEKGPIEEHRLLRRSAGLADLSARAAPAPDTGADPLLLSFLLLSEHLSASLFLLEGPKAPSALEALGATLPAPGCGAPLTLDGIPCDLCRRSLSGEDGCLIACPPDEAPRLWALLLDSAASAGIEAGPVGSQALESLAFEAGLPSPAALLGRLSPNTTTATVPEGRLAVLVTVKAGLPEPGAELRGLGRAIGICGEGSFCPSLGLFACRALVEPAFAAPGTPLLALIQGREKEGRVVQPPLYRGSSDRRAQSP